MKNRKSHVAKCTTECTEEWVARAQAGNLEILGNVLFSYRSCLSRYIMRFVRDSDLTKDIYQETCLQVIVNLPEYQNKNFRAWVFTIARNLALVYKRSYEYHHRIWADDIEDLQPSWNQGNGQMAAALLRPLLQKAITQLPPNLREVVNLRIIDQLTCEEVATRLGMTRSNVSLLDLQAHALLAKQLRQILPALGRGYTVGRTAHSRNR
jgi:RNA polymerase sigma factor (sigma-70 family)